MLQSVPVTEELCANASDAEARCAVHLATNLAATLAKAPKASFMISGGRTPPRVLFRLLQEELDWDRVVTIASDERLVPPSHPDSTEGTIARLWENARRPLDYVGLYLDNPEAAALPAGKALLDDYRHRLAEVPRPLSVAFIGMGTDGHWASLFPGRPESTDLTLDVALVPETPPHQHPRLTHGYVSLLDANSHVLVISGDKKREVWERSLSPGASELFPISTLVRQPNINITAFISL